jgi:hypothetical protein
MEHTSYADAADLFDALDAINQEGEDPVMAAVDAHGVAFLASLGDEGDSVALVYITPDDDGWPAGRHVCDECGSRGPSDWSPSWPVVTLTSSVR